MEPSDNDSTERADLLQRPSLAPGPRQPGAAAPHPPGEPVPAPDPYHALFHSMDQGFCVLEILFDATGEHVVDFRYQQLNPAFSRQSGIPEGAQGKTSRELMPDLEPFWFDTYGRVVRTGESAHLEHYVPQVGRWFDAHTFRVGAPEACQVAVLFNDITARKQAEEQLRSAAAADAFRLLLTDALGPLTDPVALQEAVTRLARQHFAADRCYYVEIEGGQGIIRRDAAADGLPPLAGTYPLADFALLQAAIKAGRPFSVRDVRQDESVDEGLRQLCVQLQAISCLNVPVGKNGQAAGVLCLVQNVPRDWTAAEATLAAEVAERTWAAVERVRAEHALAASEEKYRTLFDSIYEGVSTIELHFDEHDNAVDFRFLTVNPANIRMTGLTPEIIGKKSSEVFGSALEPFWLETYGRVAQTGEPARFEDGAAVVGRVWDVYAARVGGVDSREVVVVYTDITERKRQEANLTFLADVSDELARLTNIDDTLNVLGAKLAAHLGLSACAFVELLESAQVGIIGHGWHRPGMPSLLGTYRMDEFVAPEVLRRCRAGEAVVIRDVFADPLTDGAQYAALNIGSFVSMPLVRDGEWRYLLVAYRAEPHDWRADEIDLIREVTARIWTRLERARAEAALAASEEKYHTLFTSIDEGFVISELLYDEQGRPTDALMLETNPSYDRITRTTGGAGRRAREVFPAAESTWFEAYGQVLETGEGVRFENYFAPLDSWIEMYVARVGGAGSRRFASIFTDITARKRHENHAAFLDELSQALAVLDGPDEIVRATGEHLDAYLGVGFFNVVDVELAAGDEPAEARFTVASAWEREGLPSPRGIYRAGDYLSQEFLRAARAGEAIVIRDTDTDPRVDTEAYRAIGLRAFVAVPILNESAWPGLITAFLPSPRDWRPDEVNLLVEVAHRIFPRIERARAEVALGESEAKYRTLFETMDQGFGVGEVLPAGPGRAADFRWLEVNPQVERLTSMPQAALLTGETMRTVMPELEDIWYERYERVALTGEAVRFEQHAQVLGRWFDVYAYPLDLEGPAPYRVALLFTNITARKQAEEALRHAEERHREQLEQQVAARTQELRESRDLLHGVAESQSSYISAFGAIRDESGHIVDLEYIFVNSITEQLGGKRSMVGQRYLELFPEAENTGFMGSFRRVIETGAREDREARYDDRQLTGWFRSNATPLGDGVLVVGEDITARKQAEQERLRTLRLLEQAEAVAGLGSWDYDLLTREFLWSEGMYRLFGLPLGQAIEPRVYLDFVVDEDRPQAEQFVRCLTTGCANFEETLRLRVGGQVKTVRLKVVVLHDEAGQPVRVLGVDLDISQLQRLEADNLRLRLTQQQALFEAVQAAQEAERRRMAESLHNGIGQMLYATKLCLDRLHAPALHTLPALAAARNEADQLLGEAIRQTRVLSHELVPMVLAEFGLAAALQDVAGKMSSPTLRFHCQVQLDEDAAPLAPALQMALYRMAQELAQNIVKHARGATAAALELETMPGWALLRAEDNGVGFAQGPANSPGLGLRTIRDRVALLGGQLETGAASTGGAYVRIRIPLPASPAS